MFTTVAGDKQTSDGLRSARRFAEALSDRARVGFARAFTAAVIEAYWYYLQERHGCSLSLVSRAPALLGGRLSSAAEHEAEELGGSFAFLDPLQAGYKIGSIYTVALPPKYRSDYGAYYTPPALSRRLIELSVDAGADWSRDRILDASCGGAAFLVPCALKILESSTNPTQQGLEDVIQRLRGFEVDPFAAWMSQVLIEAALLPMCAAGGRRLPQLVQVCDSLDQCLKENDRFDLVIGNPPYGRVKLDPYQRKRFSRSLYGHANLYGVFTHAALGWLKENGIISYVTPTSMLGGQYFKALRTLLAQEAPPQAIEFVEDREGIFEGVLQETMLAVYKRGVSGPCTAVRFLRVEKDGTGTSFEAGSFQLPTVSSQPWIIPRNPEHSTLVRQLENMPTRLADYGYGVSTGPLVWNRHKGQFSKVREHRMFPVIWAESVTAAGNFEWRSERRAHLPWFRPREKDQWVITRQPCILLQRTTAKEQTRRLIAAELPLSFVRRYGGVTIENHLNMIRPIVRQPAVSTRMITALFNSKVLDDVFRCINGSVAVSAYEIESLPLPSLAEIQELDRQIAKGIAAADIGRNIEQIYAGRINEAAAIA